MTVVQRKLKRRERRGRREKMPKDVLCSSLRSQRPLRFNSFLESISGCTTHAFAARPGRNIFLSPIFLSFFVLVAARPRQVLCVSTVLGYSHLNCPEKSSQRAKILTNCSAEKKCSAASCFSLHRNPSNPFHGDNIFRRRQAIWQFTIFLGR